MSSAVIASTTPDSFLFIEAAFVNEPRIPTVTISSRTPSWALTSLTPLPTAVATAIDKSVGVSLWLFIDCFSPRKRIAERWLKRSRTLDVNVFESINVNVYNVKKLQSWAVLLCPTNTRGAAK